MTLRGLSGSFLNIFLVQVGITYAYTVWLVGNSRLTLLVKVRSKLLAMVGSLRLLGWLVGYPSPKGFNLGVAVSC